MREVRLNFYRLCRVKLISGNKFLIRAAMERTGREREKDGRERERGIA